METDRVLTEEETKTFQEGAKKQLFVNEGVDGRTVRAGEQYSVTEVARDENALYNALEMAKNGDLSGFTAEMTEKRAQIVAAFEKGGLTAVQNVVAEEQSLIKEGALDLDAIATKVGEVHFGTNSRGTQELDKAVEIARQTLEEKYNG